MRRLPARYGREGASDRRVYRTIENGRPIYRRAFAAFGIQNTVVRKRRTVHGGVSYVRRFKSTRFVIETTSVSRKT